LDISRKENSGVFEKLRAQSEAFRALGHNSTIIYMSEKDIHVDSDENTFIFKGKSRMTTKILFFERILHKMDFAAYDLMIIRYGLSYPSFIRFLKGSLSRQPKIRMVLDFPTFPYSFEWRGLKRLFLAVDRVYRTRLAKYISLAITTSTSQRIFGVPAIHISNGICVDQFPLKSISKADRAVHLVAIGKWNYWHAMDRLIHGMEKYRKQQAYSRKVFLTLIGDGPDRHNLESLVERNDLVGRIRVLKDDSEEVKKEIFQRADLAIGTLGMHRKNLDYDSSLKHREYCARGIPFILSTSDSSFPESLNFVKYVPSSNEAIDINSLLGFLDEIQENNITPADIRQYAIDHLGWKGRVQTLLDSLEEKNRVL
jgi:hypothetical protein